MGEYPHFSFNSIDDMLAFLPEFERGEFASADRHYQQTGKHLPQVQRFRNAIYATGFAFPFERVAWEEQEGQIATSSDRIPGADLLTLRKILTAFVRQEEFLEGFIPIVCSDGSVQRVIERLRQLRPPGTGARHLPRVPAKPFPQSFWVRDGLFCAGCYPGSKDKNESDQKLSGLLAGGIRLIISLMEADESSHFEPYDSALQQLANARGMSVDCKRFPIRDASVPAPLEMGRILDAIDDALARGIPTYVHCWGGHGRTSTVVACYLIRHGYSPEEAIESVNRSRTRLPKNHYPYEGSQKEFVLSWAAGE